MKKETKFANKIKDIIIETGMLCRKDEYDIAIEVDYAGYIVVSLDCLWKMILCVNIC